MTATIVPPAEAALYLTPAQWRVLVGVSGHRPAGLPQGYDADGVMKRWDADWDELLDLAGHLLLAAFGYDTFPEQPPTDQRRYTLLPTKTTRQIVPAIQAYRAVLASVDAPAVRRSGRPYKQLLSLDGVDIPTLVFLDKARLVKATAVAGTQDVTVEDAIASKAPDLRIKATARGRDYAPGGRG